MRFELELEIFEGRLELADLPEAWNTRMVEYLGVEVPDDARGVLQDVHWAGGTFGYFPTYSLGNVIAAQIWDTAQADAARPGRPDRATASWCRCATGSASASTVMEASSCPRR